MRRPNRLALSLLLLPAFLCAEEASSPKSLTVEQVLDKALSAHGGAEAFRKIKTLVMKFQVDMPAQGIKMSTEMIQKAPDLFYSLSVVPGIVRQEMGYDGKSGWAKDPVMGLRAQTEDEIAERRRSSLSAWDWRTVYKKAELKGKEEITLEGAKASVPAWVVLLTPERGKPTTRWYDAESFLLLREETVTVSPQGEMRAVAEPGDYRKVGGTLQPHLVRVSAMGMQMVMKVLEMKDNAEIDETKFLKPGEDDEAEDGEAPKHGKAPVPEP